MSEKIKFHGLIDIPSRVLEYCDTIKFKNYKTNTPKHFQKSPANAVDSGNMVNKISELINENPETLDYVFFSVCKGAEPHIDILPGDKFEDTTYVIPVILPNGKSVIRAENESHVVQVGGIYQFDHTKIHSMDLEDTESGCVVIMMSPLKLA